MICQECGRPDSYQVKHIPLPEGRNGWVELIEPERLCHSCVRAKSDAYGLLFKLHTGKEGTV